MAATADWRSLEQQGVALLNKGQIDRALEILIRTLALAEETLGKDDPHLAIPLADLGLVYDAKHNNEEAESLYEKALSVREKAFGPSHFSIAVSLYYLSIHYFHRNRYDLMKPLCERALEIWKPYEEENELSGIWMDMANELKCILKEEFHAGFDEIPPAQAEDNCNSKIYEVEVSHSELNRYRLIRGNDEHSVKQKAEAQKTIWDEVWRKKEEQGRKLSEKQSQAEQSLERSRQASEALQGIQNTPKHVKGTELEAAREGMQDHAAFSKLKPEKPDILKLHSRYKKPKKPALPPKPKKPKFKEETFKEPEPKEADQKYRFELTFLGRVLSFVYPSIRKKAEDNARSLFRNDHEQWEKERIEWEEKKKQEKEKQLKPWKKECVQWEEKKKRMPGKIMHWEGKLKKWEDKILEETGKLEALYQNQLMQWEAEKGKLVKKQNNQEAASGLNQSVNL